MPEFVPNEMARILGVTGLSPRNWLRAWGAEVFVMSGPMERRDRVQHAARELQAWWAPQ